MPELPEVETTLRGVKPLTNHQMITAVHVYERRLRWPVPNKLPQVLRGQVLMDIKRRGKYILFITSLGTLILHLGMSGSLRVLNHPKKREKHDHIEIHFANKYYLRFTDPRRFGCLLWTSASAEEHFLLNHLGPEPLSTPFNGRYLEKKARGKKLSIKSFLMDSKIVVGIGNIYATEILFAARVHPLLSVQHVSSEQWQHIAKHSKIILRQAIKKGGTTLKDFIHSEGKPGYFTASLKVYGREKEGCIRCETPLSLLRIANRSTVFCPKCQPIVTPDAY